MNIIIAGTRTFNDYALLEKKMHYFLRDTESSNVTIISGTADGADKLGERYAKQYGLRLRQFPADWVTHGKAAGPIRNKEMAQHADACVVFWDGKSRGTKNMIEEAKKHKLKLRIILYAKTTPTTN